MSVRNVAKPFPVLPTLISMQEPIRESSSTPVKCAVSALLFKRQFLTSVKFVLRESHLSVKDVGRAFKGSLYFKTRKAFKQPANVKDVAEFQVSFSCCSTSHSSYLRETRHACRKGPGFSYSSCLYKHRKPHPDEEAYESNQCDKFFTCSPCLKYPQRRQTQRFFFKNCA